MNNDVRKWEILVVDDERGLLRSIERILSDKYNIVTTESSLEAVEIAIKMQPDIAIIDIRMPQLDGFELLDRLKEVSENTEVILMTGSMDDTNKKLVRAIRGKAFFYLIKPFDRGVLLALVNRCLELKTLELANKEYTKNQIKKNIELEEKNSQLETLLSNLHATQNQLVQSEKMATVGSLAASFLHEINTPMGALVSSVDTLIRCTKKTISELKFNSNSVEQENIKILNTLEVIHNNTKDAIDRINSVVKELKLFTPMEGAEVAESDLHQGLKSCVEIIKRDIADNKITIKEDYGKLPTVIFNRFEMNYVFLNLLKYSLKTMKNKGTVTVKTFSSNDHMNVKISGTGKGMKKEEMTKIFEPCFDKKGHRVKGEFRLLVTHLIVQRNGGSITVENIPEGGSAFTVTLPIINRLK